MEQNIWGGGSFPSFCVQGNKKSTRKKQKKTYPNLRSARRQRTEDLLVNLFKGYKAASDKKFVTYIEQKEDEYNEGKDIDAISLMELAETKYKTLLETDKWKQPSAEQKTNRSVIS